jgi:hypothetical protein
VSPYTSLTVSLLPFNVLPPSLANSSVDSEKGVELMVGRTTAFTKVTFYDKSDRVVAFGSHTKHMGTNKATKRFSEDGETELPLEEKAKL